MARDKNAPPPAAPTFVVGASYTRPQIADALGDARASGPYLEGRAALALVADVGGDGDGEPSFPSRSSIQCPGPAPARAVDHKTPVHLFIARAGTDAAPIYAGEIHAYTYATRPGPHNVEFALTPPLPRAQWHALLGKLPPPEPPPETELVALTADSGPHERWAAMASFLARWRNALVPETPRWHGLQGLERVRETVRALAAIPDAFHHNYLVEPDELEIEDGRIVFLYENQSVCLWAAEPDGDDPRVWYRNNDDGEPWLEEPERLSGFLIQAVLFEAIGHARFGANVAELPVEEADAIVGKLRPLAGGRWNWLGARFYARDGALAYTMENPPGVDVSLAAATPLALSPFEDLVEGWDAVRF